MKLKAVVKPGHTARWARLNKALLIYVIVYIIKY
jgi:hypothetical protein